MRKLIAAMVLTFGWLAAPWALADVQSSKANGYAVIAPPAGVSASKANGYAVIAPPAGVSASKANGYAVIAPPLGVSASKVIGYVVLAPATKQPSVFIMTRFALPFRIMALVDWLRLR